MAPKKVSQIHEAFTVKRKLTVNEVVGDIFPRLFVLPPCLSRRNSLRQCAGGRMDKVSHNVW